MESWSRAAWLAQSQFVCRTPSNCKVEPKPVQVVGSECDRLTTNQTNTRQNEDRTINSRHFKPLIITIALCNAPTGVDDENRT